MIRDGRALSTDWTAADGESHLVSMSSDDPLLHEVMKWPDAGIVSQDVFNRVQSILKDRYTRVKAFEPLLKIESIGFDAFVGWTEQPAM